MVDSKDVGDKVTRKGVDMSEQVEEWLTKNLPHTQQELLERYGIVTPIGLARAVGVTPQVIYNYIRNDRIGARTNESGKKVIPRDALYEYIQKRLDKEQAKQDKLERELRGEA